MSKKVKFGKIISCYLSFESISKLNSIAKLRNKSKSDVLDSIIKEYYQKDEQNAIKEVESLLINNDFFD